MLFWLSLYREGKRNQEGEGNAEWEQGKTVPAYSLAEDGERCLYSHHQSFQIMDDSTQLLKSTALRAFRTMKTKGSWIRMQNSIFRNHLSINHLFILGKDMQYPVTHTRYSEFLPGPPEPQPPSHPRMPVTQSQEESIPSAPTVLQPSAVPNPLSTLLPEHTPDQGQPLPRTNLGPLKILSKISFQLCLQTQLFSSHTKQPTICQIFTLSNCK